MRYMYKIPDNAVNYEGVLCFLFKEKRGNCFFPKKEHSGS